MPRLTSFRAGNRIDFYEKSKQWKWNGKTHFSGRWIKDENVPNELKLLSFATRNCRRYAWILWTECVICVGRMLILHGNAHANVDSTCKLYFMCLCECDSRSQSKLSFSSTTLILCIYVCNARSSNKRNCFSPTKLNFATFFMSICIIDSYIIY